MGLDRKTLEAIIKLSPPAYIIGNCANVKCGYNFSARRVVSTMHYLDEKHCPFCGDWMDIRIVECKVP